jgi:hypothetical protein
MRFSDAGFVCRCLYTSEDTKDVGVDVNVAEVAFIDLDVYLHSQYCGKGRYVRRQDLGVGCCQWLLYWLLFLWHSWVVGCCTLGCCYVWSVFLVWG